MSDLDKGFLLGLLSGAIGIIGGQVLYIITGGLCG